jgi:hypothetical protein
MVLILEPKYTHLARSTFRKYLIHIAAFRVTKKLADRHKSFLVTNLLKTYLFSLFTLHLSPLTFHLSPHTSHLSPQLSPIHNNLKNFCEPQALSLDLSNEDIYPVQRLFKF